MNLRLLFLGIGLVTTAVFTAAQVERVLPRRDAQTLEGREFIVGFMQNEVVGYGVPSPILEIYISSQYDAVVQVEHANRTIETLNIRAFDVHVVRVQPLYMVSVSESRQRAALFITSDVPIVVYTLNSIQTSTDSYAALPIPMLGQQYRTVNSPNDHYLAIQNADDFEFAAAVRTSEFMIMAPDDNTRVQIYPTWITERGIRPGEVIQVTLNRGDCYLVKGRQTQIRSGDMTGSHIVADKPVAVLSGHVRASYPVDERNSKDHLVEMLPPMDKWGKKYVAAPFAVMSAPGLVKVVAADNNTTITISTAWQTINTTIAQAGQGINVVLEEPMTFSSDKYFMAAQVMPSRQYQEGNALSLDGDPAMVVLPATDQFVQSATFRFPELLPQQELGASQRYHYYVNLVAEREALSTLRIDGRLAVEVEPLLQWQVMPSSTLHWANVQLSTGTHTISSDSGRFSAIMYGMSRADSYANLAGISFDKETPVDPTPPRFYLTVDCGNVVGTVTDTSINDPLLENLTVQTSRTYNYDWLITEPQDTLGTRSVEARVRNLWADAQLVIHAWDSQGNGREWLYQYHAPTLSVPSRIDIDDTVYSGCERVPIVNDGDRPLVVENVRIQGDIRFSLVDTNSYRLEIPPKDTAWVDICFRYDSSGSPANGTLFVELGCGLERAIPISRLIRADLIAEDLDFGAVRIGDTLCKRTPVINVGTQPVLITRLVLDRVLEPFVVDTAGLRLPFLLGVGDTVWVSVCFTPTAMSSWVRTDTINSSTVPDRTVTYRGRGIRPDVRGLVIDWGRRRVGQPCDTTVRLQNAGESACVLDTVLHVLLGAFDANGFTLPRPMAPYESVDVPLTFTPNTEGSVADTILITVDWRYHDTVRIILLGVGTIPAVRTIDVDMGSVVVGSSKDSIAAIIESYGTENLTITATQLSGPDIGSLFTTMMTAPHVMATGTAHESLVSFRPQRVGVHEVFVDIVCDAAPYGQQVARRVRIHGVGVPEPVENLDVQVIAPLALSTCVDTVAHVHVRNTGNVPVLLESVTATLDGEPLSIPLALPTSIQPDSSVLVDLRCSLTRSNIAELMVEVTYSPDRREVVHIPIQVASGSINVDVQVPPSPSIGEVITADINIRSTQERSVAENIVFTVECPRDRWIPELGTVDIQIRHADGVFTDQVALESVTKGVRVALNQSVRSPFEIQASIRGQVLWKDPTETEIRVLVEENQCTAPSENSAFFNVQVCGGLKRMIRLEGREMATLKLVQQPAHGSINAVIETSQSMHVLVYLVDVQGTRSTLSNTLALEKGSHHCIFSVTSWPSGLYSLILQYGSGEVALPVLIVN